jgi:hypothetical protein
VSADARFTNEALDPDDIAEYYAVLDERRAAAKTAAPQHRPAYVDGRVTSVTNLPDIADYRAN